MCGNRFKSLGSVFYPLACSLDVMLVLSFGLSDIFERLILQRAEIVTMADSNVLSITFVNALSGDGIEMQVADPGRHRTNGFSCRGLPWNCIAISDTYQPVQTALFWPMRAEC